MVSLSAAIVSAKEPSPDGGFAAGQYVVTELSTYVPSITVPPMPVGVAPTTGVGVAVVPVFVSMLHGLAASDVAVDVPLDEAAELELPCVLGPPESPKLYTVVLELPLAVWTWMLVHDPVSWNSMSASSHAVSSVGGLPLQLAPCVDGVDESDAQHLASAAHSGPRLELHPAAVTKIRASAESERMQFMGSFVRAYHARFVPFSPRLRRPWSPPSQRPCDDPPTPASMTRVHVGGRRALLPPMQ